MFLIVPYLLLIALPLLLRKYMAGKPCTLTNSLRGKYVFITGANSGIGKATALQLAQRGARIIMACRTQSTAQAVSAQIQKISPDSKPVLLTLDLSDLNSVSKCIEQFKSAAIPRVDILINNAGIFTFNRELTAQGVEAKFAVNYLAPFYLTKLLV